MAQNYDNCPFKAIIKCLAIQETTVFWYAALLYVHIINMCTYK